MALTPDEIAAISTLRLINGGDKPTPGGLGEGGHRDWFVPGLHAMADVTDAVAREAEAAASAAASASAQSASLSGTSTTSIAISAGSKTLATQGGKAFTVGTFLLLTSNANPTTHYIFGQVTAYSGTSLTINVTSFAGSGSRADWTIRVAGGPGVQGGPGPAPTLAIGTVTTGPSADANITGSNGAYELDLELPASTVPGPPGAQILNGARDPVVGDGNNGDYWMQTADGTTGLLGDYWSKSSGTWTKLFNTRGPAGSGSGDMTGPNGGVVDGEIMVSNGTTGKALKGTGKSLTSLATAAQGEKADTALQPAALDDYTPTANLPPPVAIASAATIRAGTNDADATGVKSTWDAHAPVAVSLASLDMATFINGFAGIAANTTVANPTNTKAGQNGVIEVTITGTRTLTWGSAWRKAAKSPAAPTTGSFLLTYYVASTGAVVYAIAEM